MVPITIDSVCRTCGTQVRLAEHLATQRQTAAGYDTFFSLVEKALLSPDLDRFRRDYLQVRPIVREAQRELVQWGWRATTSAVAGRTLTLTLP